jgi:hypothetical protein
MNVVPSAQVRALNLALNDDRSSKKRIVVVPHATQLLTKTYYTKMAIASSNLNMPRRKFPDWMADALFLRDVEFRFRDGSLYEIGDDEIDFAFGYDGSFRWLDDFTNLSRLPLRQNPHHTIELRLRLIALSFWVDYPEIAKHFAV